jgi:mutual gliding-motility protein MglA
VSVVNPLAREISAKIVYYGPGLSGKTTSLKSIYEKLSPKQRGQLITLATEGDRTIFFDFLPVHVDKVKNLDLRLQLYTVPGQVFYASTRRLVLDGADAVVFVADSQPECRDSNLESLNDLYDNLERMGIEAASLPFVFQFNKRDLPNVRPVQELSAELNRFGAPEFATSASLGKGITEAWREVVRGVVKNLWDNDGQPSRKKQSTDPPRRSRASASYKQLPVESGGPGASGSTRQTPRPHTPSASGAASARSSQSGAATHMSHAIEQLNPETVRKNAAQTHGGGVSFRSLWEDEGRRAIARIEGQISAGAYSRAVHSSAEVLAELLNGLPGQESSDGPKAQAMLLGLDGREYLTLCRLASLPAESVGLADALFALYMLVGARLKLRQIHV